MAGYNRITLVGNLTRDPELKTSVNGTRFARMGLAVNRLRKRGAESETDFFNLVAFKGTAEMLGKYCSKGARILVEGPLQFSVLKEAPEAKPSVWHSVIVDRVLFLERASRPVDKPAERPEIANSRPKTGHAKSKSSPRPRIDEEDEDE